MNTGYLLIGCAAFALALTSPALNGPAWSLDLALPGQAHETAHRADADAVIHLPVGPYRDGQVKTLILDGQFVQSAWSLSGLNLDTAEITADLRAQFQEQGYQTLFSCQTAECGGFDFRYNAGILPAPEMYIDLGQFSYLVARKGQGTDAEHLALVVSRSDRTGFVQLTRVAAGSSQIEPIEQHRLDPASATAEPLQPVSKGLAARQMPLAMPPAGVAQSSFDRLDRGLSVVLDDLVFAPGSSQLAGDNFKSVQMLGDWLRSNPQARLALVGHTDDIGSLQANVKISRLRAEAVRQQLLFLGGIDPARIDAEGAGYLSPRQSNQTEEGRQQNRRVEAVPLTSTP